ncbi:hypothetical protein ACT8ZV_20560 [Nocardioides sp. MAHUQ-72]|uniref:hypothetical protein n=1 Tax=unclassified Nocardioides TaxID=2615069 RepID=UPI00360C0EBE
MQPPPPSASHPDGSGAARRRSGSPLVAVPGAVDPADEVELADDGTLVATLGRVSTSAELHCSRAVGAVAECRPRFRPGPEDGTVVAAASHVADVSEDLAPLDRLAAQLAEDGWQRRHLAGQDAARMVAERDDLRLTASYAPATGAFLLEVVSAPLAVGATRARRLVSG